MQSDTIADWQRLTQLYREMCDEELYALEADIVDLTDLAQQVLRDEMRTRGLSRPRATVVEPKNSDYPAAPSWDSNADSLDSEDKTEDSDLPHEYTWKTLLCECGDGVEAWQLREALRQAGIESWIDGPGYHVVADMLNPRILVAADQLEQAREIASRPIPQAIVELSNMPDEEYVPSVCPKCGAEDPVLESADPVNSWQCESCGAQWTDAVEDKTESS